MPEGWQLAEPVGQKEAHVSERRAPNGKVVRIVTVVVVAIAAVTFIGSVVGIIITVPQIREMYADAFRDLLGS
jgi:hypothetical protein